MQNFARISSGGVVFCDNITESRSSILLIGLRQGKFLPPTPVFPIVVEFVVINIFTHLSLTSSLQSLDINSLELLTVVVALKLWGDRWKGLRLTVRCDNLVAVTVLSTGKCCNPFLSACLREICYLTSVHNFELRAVHLAGVNNTAANLLSRWSTDLTAPHRFLNFVHKHNLTEVPVPDQFFLADNPL